MNNKNERKIKRGDIYLYDFGDNEGSIQCGYRPVVVLQADNFNAKAPTIMVAAITTAIRKTFLPSHILVEDKYGLTEPSMIMLEQQRAINKDELVNYVGHIDDNNVLRKIHNGLMKLYGYWDYARYNKANITTTTRRLLMMFEEKIAKLNSQQDRKKSYSVPEIQKILKVERHTVYKLIKEGHFKAAFIGGKWRISRLSFDLWLDGKE